MLERDELTVGQRCTMFASPICEALPAIALRQASATLELAIGQTLPRVEYRLRRPYHQYHAPSGGIEATSNALHRWMYEFGDCQPRDTLVGFSESPSGRHALFRSEVQVHTLFISARCREVFHLLLLSAYQLAMRLEGRCYLMMDLLPNTSSCLGCSVSLVTRDVF